MKHGETDRPLGVLWLGEEAEELWGLARRPRIAWIESTERYGDAREIAERLGPDVIVLYRSPSDLTALETIPALRRQFPNIALLYLAGRESTRLGAEAAWHGADEVGSDEIAASPELWERALRRAQRRHRARTRLAIEQRRLKAEAITDSLTGAYNRRFFDAQLSREIGRSHRYSEPLSLLMLDLDHFKQINDNYGHQVGDRVLQEIVQVTRRTIRTSDLLARFGGEEFTLILPSTDPAGAAHLAERLLQRIARHAFPIEDGERKQGVTVSIGLAYYSGADEEISPETFVNVADRALYRAKQDGRNRLGLMSESGERSRSVEAEG